MKRDEGKRDIGVCKRGCQGHEGEGVVVQE